jgi:catechol 2,3-dioxygenase-like lactoylglutathione lyase family enzyme
MRLEGLHHITMITGDAQSNVAFYADTLGRHGNPQHEHLGARLERTLVPIVNPRAARRQEQHA